MNQILQLNQIGIVKSNFFKPTDPLKMKKYESMIIIDKNYEEGLYKIEDSEYLQILFNFHLAKGFNLKDKSYDGNERGIFASRSSIRPNTIGLTKVKLISKKGRKLLVTGLDALDGSPIIDIKRV